MSSRRNLAAFVYIALVWGGSYPAIEFGLAALDPLFFAATRLLVAAVATLPVAAWAADGREWLPNGRADWAYIGVGGVFLTGLANGFLFVGQQYATGGVGAVVISLNPVLAAGLASIWLPQERLTTVEGGGVLLGLIGAIIVVNPSADALSTGFGWIFLFFAAASFAVGSVTAKRLDPDLSSLGGAGWGLLLGALLLLAGTTALGRPVGIERMLSTPKLLATVIYLGVVATAGAYAAYFALLSAVGPVRTNLVSYVVPVVAALLGAALLGEPLTVTMLVGFLLVALGFAILEGDALR